MKDARVRQAAGRVVPAQHGPAMHRPVIAPGIFCHIAIDHGIIVKDFAPKILVQIQHAAAQILARGLVRREQHIAVQPEILRLPVQRFKAKAHSAQVYFPQARLAAFLAPGAGGFHPVGDDRDAIDHHHRLAVIAHPAGIFHHGDHFIAYQGDVAFQRIVLLHQDMAVLAIPVARPILIGPADTKTGICAG